MCLYVYILFEELRITKSIPPKKYMAHYSRAYSNRKNEKMKLILCFFSFFLVFSIFHWTKLNITRSLSQKFSTGWLWTEDCNKNFKTFNRYVCWKFSLFFCCFPFSQFSSSFHLCKIEYHFLVLARHGLISSCVSFTFAECDCCVCLFVRLFGFFSSKVFQSILRTDECDIKWCELTFSRCVDGNGAARVHYTISLHPT